MIKKRDKKAIDKAFSQALSCQPGRKEVKFNEAGDLNVLMDVQKAASVMNYVVGAMAYF